MEKIDIKTEVMQETNFFYEETTTVNLLDNLLKARDELFDKRLKYGFDAHKKLNDLILLH